ncbi:hypothetical protein JHK82_019043 [Glycine max]|nr:hypothetical protein JHK85_019485 [Glycine max]KAG5038225.1 hypothetical protein JHK86_019065 [Glycine max]KAG5143348.1 hypothetical protein JHK82_019043 [Glycine max]
MTVIALIKALARERMNDELSQVLLNILRSCKLNDAKVAKVLLEETSQKVTHPVIAQSQTHLTVEFLSDMLPKISGFLSFWYDLHGVLHFIPLESINNIHSGDSLPPSVLSVGNNIRNNILEEDLEDIMSFLVDKTTDSLNISSPSQMRNYCFGMRCGEDLNRESMMPIGIQCIEVDVHPQICVVVEVAVCGGGRWCLWLEVGMIVEEDRLEVVATEEGLGKRIRLRDVLKGQQAVVKSS